MFLLSRSLSDRVFLYSFLRSLRSLPSARFILPRKALCLRYSRQYSGFGESLLISRFMFSLLDIRLLIYTSNSCKIRLDRSGLTIPRTPVFGYINFLPGVSHSIYPALTSFQYRFKSFGSLKCFLSNLAIISWSILSKKLLMCTPLLSLNLFY